MLQFIERFLIKTSFQFSVLLENFRRRFCILGQLIRILGYLCIHLFSLSISVYLFGNLLAGLSTKLFELFYLSYKVAFSVTEFVPCCIETALHHIDLFGYLE